MSLFIRRLTSVVVIVLLLSILSDGAQVNKTIDDDHSNNSNGANVVYDGAWIPSIDCGISESSVVNSCLQGIDPPRANDGTWTSMASDPPAELVLTFNGTAIYAYHIILAQDDSLPSEYTLTCSIDGQLSATRTCIKSSETQYNQLLCSIESLNNTAHTFSVRPGPDSSQQMIFDYALYTSMEDDTTSTLSPSPTSLRTAVTIPHSSSNSHPDIALIVGAVFGAIGGSICVLIVLVIIIRRRRNKRSAQNRALPEGWIDTKEDPPMTNGLPNATDKIVSLGMVQYVHVLTHDTQAIPSPVQAEPIVHTNIGEQADLESNVCQPSEPGADHRNPLLSDEISAGNTRGKEVDREETAHWAYVAMLETEVGRLQSQLDEIISSDILPSYHTSSDDERLSSNLVGDQHQ